MQPSQVLSLDLEPTDYLYRIRLATRIIYVSLHHTPLIPTTDRTDSSRILAILRTLPGWQGQQWTTLTVHHSSKGLSLEYDAFEPHRLAPTALTLSVPRYSFLEFTVVDRITDRVSMVTSEDLGGKKWVRKITRFRHELRAVQTEIKAYHVLDGCSITPKFVGYVYEETEDRVVGFLIKAVEGGRHPGGVEDYEICRSGVLELHRRGVVHGDLSRGNIVTDGDKAKFIDFEAASFRMADEKRCRDLEREEVGRLAEILVEELENHG